MSRTVNLAVFATLCCLDLAQARSYDQIIAREHQMFNRHFSKDMVVQKKRQHKKKQNADDEEGPQKSERTSTCVSADCCSRAITRMRNSTDDYTTILSAGSVWTDTSFPYTESIYWSNLRTVEEDVDDFSAHTSSINWNRLSAEFTDTSTYSMWGSAGVNPEDAI